MPSGTLVSAGGSIVTPTAPPLYVPNVLPGLTLDRRYVSKYLVGADGAAIGSVPNLGSDGGAALAQAAAERQPVLYTKDGRRGLKFDGVDDVLTSYLAIENPVLTTAVTAYMVVEMPENLGTQRIPWGWNNRRPVTGNGGAETITFWGSSGAIGSAFTYTPGWNFYAAQMWADGKVRFWQNGSALPAAPIQVGTTTANLLTLGGFSATDTTYNLGIGFFEEGLKKGTTPLSDANIADIRAAMKSVYPGLP